MYPRNKVQYMSEDSLTELEQGIDSDIIESIDDTFEAEESYSEYVEKERENRRKKRERERQEQIKQEQKKREKRIAEYREKSEKSLRDDIESDKIHLDTKLTENTARIHKIDKMTNRDIFVIHLKEKNDNITKHRVKIGLPEDESNEWVRLCKWFNVDPSKPTELRGEIVPIKIKKDKTEIDIPPIDAGLNPYSYKIKRTYAKLSSKPISKKAGELIDKSFPWWGTAMGAGIGSGIMFIGLYLIRIISVFSSSVIGGIIFLAGAILLSVSITYGLYYWGLGSIAFIFLTLVRIVSRMNKVLFPQLKKVYEYFFPK